MNEDSEHDALQPPQDKQRSQNDQNNSYLQDEENQREKSSNHHAHDSKTNNVFNFGNRKRREIKLEREELTNLFAELIMLVNDRVTELDGAPDKPKLQPMPLLKNKPRSSKQKRQQSPKLPTALRLAEEPTISRKQSTKQERNHSKQQQQRQRLKKQVLQNYEGIMTYKFHTEEEQAQEMLHENMESNCNDSNYRQNKGKQFGVFQSVSLMINPLGNNNC